MKAVRGLKKRDYSIKKKEEEEKEAFATFQIDYCALLEKVPGVTYITALDETESRLYISPQIEKMLGFPLSDWFSNPQLWFKQIYPDDRKRVLDDFYRSHKNGKPFRSEYRLMARDGRIVWVRDEGIVLKDKDGNPRFIQGFMYDVSELLEAKEAIRESEAKFQSIFEGMAVGIALVSPDGRIMESNRAFQKMLGYRGEELFNRSMKELVHPDDTIQDLELQKQLMDGTKDYYQIERRYIRKDGETVWGRLSVSLGQGLREKHTIHMIEDITGWKQLEMQFLQSQKMETVGRLAGGIAHDLNNLFTVLGGYSQLALLQTGGDHPLRSNLEEIKRTVDRAAELTQRLLAISRRQTMNMKVFNLNRLLQGLEKMLVRIIREDIELILRLADDLGEVKTDPGQIEQAILNLVVNARDAMPQGGKLIIETRNVELDKTYVQSHFDVVPGQYVSLSVTDTGCGMSPEVKERIFDPFFTTKSEGKGTGLGLSTVYGIVKQSGGYVWVYSEPQRGTTFKIYLPRVEEKLDNLTSPEEMGDFPKGEETLLLVEDEEALRNLTAKVLRDQGYTVLEAANGDEAIKLARNFPKRIHLLVTDLVMPQMGGKELVEQFKRLHPDCRVLFISGYTDEVMTDQGLLGHGALFLQKPFSPFEFLRKIREVLS